jgi:hypothetical protein
MNFRRGMARLARVTALAYWAVAILVAGGAAIEAYRAAAPNPFDQFARAPDPNKPWEAYWKAYTADIGGRKIGFLAPNEAALDVEVKRWAAEHPPGKPIRDGATAALKALAAAAAIYAVLWVIFRAVRWIALGFMDRDVATPP